jgi:zinc/manganese transport system permease protein
MFEAAFMRVALVASLAASLPLSTIGVYLILRRMVFLGLVLANAATVGTAVAQLLAWPPEITAIIAALTAAVALGVMPSPRHVPAESINGWAYAAAASATVLILARTTAAEVDTLHLLYGNVLAVSASHTVVLIVVALAVGVAQLLFGSRFLLVTFDAEAAQVAGVKTRAWSVCLNLAIGVAAAAAVHEIGVLLTFSLMTLAPMASLFVTRRIRTTFAVAALVGVSAVWGGLVLAYHLDLPPGPISVSWLAAAVVAAAVVSHWRA